VAVAPRVSSSARPLPVTRRSEQVAVRPYTGQAVQGKPSPVRARAPEKNNQSFLQSAGRAFHGQRFRQVTVVEEDGEDGQWTVNILNQV